MELMDKEVFPATRKARVQAMKRKGISHDSERWKQVKKLLISYWYLLGASAELEILSILTEVGLCWVFIVAPGLDALGHVGSLFTNQRSNLSP